MLEVYPLDPHVIYQDPSRLIIVDIVFFFFNRMPKSDCAKVKREHGG